MKAKSQVAEQDARCEESDETKFLGQTVDNGTSDPPPRPPGGAGDPPPSAKSSSGKKK